MLKTLTFFCQDCGEKHSFTYGADKMSTLQDVLDVMKKEDVARLVETMNRITAKKTVEQRTSFMMNHADGLTMIHYPSCGDSIHLLEAADIKGLEANYIDDQKRRIEDSLKRFVYYSKFEGVMAFNAMFYCRKCRRIQQGMFLRLHAVEDNKPHNFLIANKCERCGGDTVLINDDNVGYLAEDLTVRCPCPMCGGKMLLGAVSFKP